MMKKILLLVFLISFCGFSQDENIKEDRPVPFEIIEMKPIFPSCKDLIDSKIDKCNNEKIKNFINKNMDFDLISKYIPKKSTIKISFYFGIDGKVEKVNSTAPNNNIMVKNEIESTMSNLPKIIPAMQKGRKVRVKYSLNLYVN